MKSALARLLVCFAALYQLPLARAAESTVRFLTTASEAVDYWPCFSPDSKNVLFSRSMDRGKTWELFIVPSVGGDAHKLAPSPLPLPVSATRANWSMRNTLIAFTGTSRNGSSTWVIGADGSSPHSLAPAGLSDQVFYPSWYPNGEQLAVMDARDQVIKRIDQKRDISETLTDHKQILAGMPSVSPDGKWIALAGQANAGQPYDQTKNSIWLVSDTGVLRTLETPSFQGRAPSWSPDGKRVAFESNRGSANRSYAIFVINRDGTQLTQVTDYDMDANHPVWSPDGRQLVFSARLVNGENRTGIAIVDSPNRY